MKGGKFKYVYKYNIVEKQQIEENGVFKEIRDKLLNLKMEKELEEKKLKLNNQEKINNLLVQPRIEIEDINGKIKNFEKERDEKCEKLEKEYKEKHNKIL